MLQGNIQYIYFYSNFVKKAFTRALMTAFEHEIVPPQYRFSRKHTDRQIFIWRDYPRRNVRYPLIVVTTKTGDISKTYLGEEYSGEVKAGEESDRFEGPKGTGYLFSGMLEITVEVEVVCKALRDIENIFDLTSFFVRHLFVKEFYNNNIAYTKIIVNGQSFEDGLYKNKLTIDVHTEYNNLVPADLYEKITGVFVSPTPVL